MVSGKALSKIALNLNFENLIVMNEKGMKNEWNKNARLLEDAMEAIIGSIYLDKGLKECENFITTKIIESFNEDDLLEDTNYKDILMRYIQGRKIRLPEYKLVDELKLNNIKEFKIHIYINDKMISEGIHKTKKQAEQIAARRCLKCFNLL